MEDGVRGSTGNVPRRVVEGHRKEPDRVTIQLQPMVARIVSGQLSSPWAVIHTIVQLDMADLRIGHIALVLSPAAWERETVIVTRIVVEASFVELITAGTSPPKRILARTVVLISQEVSSLPVIMRWKYSLME